MTAYELLHGLRAAGCNPSAVEGFELLLDAEPPANLAKYIPALQTGIRAILTRRHWFYTAVPGTHRAGGELDPTLPLPRTAHLLTVEGDDCWDRMHPTWILDMPELFHLPDVNRKQSQSRKAVMA